MNTESPETFFCGKKIKFLSVFIFFILYGSSIFSQGNLIIYPQRLVFDGKKSAEKLVLSNTGKDSAVYNISFVEYKMTEFGEMQAIEVEETGVQFASPYVRIYPRNVLLGPNESQVVKVQTYNTQGLADGEYRSHIYFRAQKDNLALGTAKKIKEEVLSVNLEAVFGISIACILRKGIDNTAVSISDIVYSNPVGDDHYLNFKINRNGNMSAYGDFRINYTSAKNKIYELATLKGIGVYLPGSVRNMKIKLNKPVGVNLKEGAMNVVFMQNEGTKVLAEGKLKL